MDLETALRRALTGMDAAKDTTEFAACRLEFMRILDCPHPFRKWLALVNLEFHAREALGLSHGSSVDWSRAGLNWFTIITALIKWLPMILALLGL